MNPGETMFTSMLYLAYSRADVTVSPLSPNLLVEYIDLPTLLSLLHKEPIFTKYDIEKEITKMFEAEVKLRSGGYIVINPTEALVAIDVNSGGATKERNIEKTALKTNLEAAEEIARQLRLRDIGGIIVIDFIDMESTKKQQSLLNRFKQELAKDKTRTQVFEISRLGLVEMTRKNVAAGLVESFSEECEKCNGRGLIINDIFANKSIEEGLIESEAVVE